MGKGQGGVKMGGGVGRSSENGVKTGWVSIKHMDDIVFAPCQAFDPPRRGRGTWQSLS